MQLRLYLGVQVGVKMPKGIYVRCQVTEFDMAKYCTRKAVGNSWLHEPYYKDRKDIPLCKSHLAWINRPESDYELDYHEWVNNL